MRSGPLRHWLSLQRKVISKTAMGGETSGTWEEVCKIWGEITPVSSREFFAAQQIQSNVTHTIRVRYRTDLVATMRIVEVCNPGVAYDIQGAPMADNKRISMNLMCVTRDADGWRG